MHPLEEIRARLSVCDDEIITALAHRMTLIQEIIACKQQYGIPILQPEREASEKKALHQKLCGNEFLPEIEAIYRSIVESSKQIQAKALFSDNLYLIGFMGTGKSSVADTLSRLLAKPVQEMDAIITARAGMPITEIFDRYGEEYFRNLESNLIMELGKQSGAVISCGGGAALRAKNVENMKQNGRIILLTASPETILSRIGSSADRPILNGRMNVPDIRALMETRRDAYEAAADLTIETDGKTVTEVCEEIVQQMHKLSQVTKRP